MVRLCHMHGRGRVRCRVVVFFPIIFRKNKQKSIKIMIFHVFFVLHRDAYVTGIKVECHRVRRALIDNVQLP